MQLLSINAGSASSLFVRQHEEVHRIMTAIHKKPLEGSVEIRRLGVAGDEQVDLSVHGGLDKAVYAYPVEHYAFWNAQRRDMLRTEEPLAWGSLGENLTIQGLLESEVWIGDRLQAGAVLLEVTEPRQPCFKFNVRMGYRHASKQMLQSGMTGFYLKVLETGSVAAGDRLHLQAGPREVSVSSINQRRFRGRQRELFDEVLPE